MSVVFGPHAASGRDQLQPKPHVQKNMHEFFHDISFTHDYIAGNILAACTNGRDADIPVGPDGAIAHVRVHDDFVTVGVTPCLAGAPPVTVFRLYDDSIQIPWQEWQSAFERMGGSGFKIKGSGVIDPSADPNDWDNVYTPGPGTPYFEAYLKYYEALGAGLECFVNDLIPLFHVAMQLPDDTNIKCSFDPLRDNNRAVRFNLERPVEGGIAWFVWHGPDSDEFGQEDLCILRFKQRLSHLGYGIAKRAAYEPLSVDPVIHGGHPFYVRQAALEALGEEEDAIRSHLIAQHQAELQSRMSRLHTYDTRARRANYLLTHTR